jgi:hypothetical protein
MFASITFTDAFGETVVQFFVSMIMNSSVSKVRFHYAPSGPLLNVKLAPASQ